MDDRAFLRELQNQFKDVPIPETLKPNNVAAHLRKRPQAAIVHNWKRIVAVAAVFVLIAATGVLTLGSLLQNNGMQADTSEMAQYEEAAPSAQSVQDNERAQDGTQFAEGGQKPEEKTITAEKALLVVAICILGGGVVAVATVWAVRLLRKR